MFQFSKDSKLAINPDLQKTRNMPRVISNNIIMIQRYIGNLIVFLLHVIGWGHFLRPGVRELTYTRFQPAINRPRCVK